MNLFKYRYLALSSFLISGTVLLSSLGLSASAASIMKYSLGGDAANFGSDEVKADFTLEQKDSKTVEFKIDVDTEVNWADLRGFFFNIKDESLLSGLTLSDPTNTITNHAFSANKKSRQFGLSSNANINGGSPIADSFDGGLEIGTQGTGSDDIQSVTFSLSHNSGLSLDQFDGQGFGIRMMSVGSTQKGSREGSSKLAAISELAPVIAQVTQTPSSNGPVDIPEPTALVGLGLVGVAAARVRRSKDTKA